MINIQQVNIWVRLKSSSIQSLTPIEPCASLPALAHVLQTVAWPPMRHRSGRSIRVYEAGARTDNALSMPDAPIAAFHYTPPHVAARASMSNTSLPAMEAGECGRARLIQSPRTVLLRRLPPKRNECATK
jgi:hypothetical protein